MVLHVGRELQKTGQDPTTKSPLVCKGHTAEDKDISISDFAAKEKGEPSRSCSLLGVR